MRAARGQRMWSRTRLAVVSVLVATAVVGCTTSIDGAGTYADGVKPNAQQSDLKIKGSDGGSIDKLAANSLDDIQAYWKTAFPDAFGKNLKPLAGGFYSYSPDQKEKVPCVGSAKDGAGNAFYCPSGDLIAYDRDFLGQLAKEYGDVIVTLVLAHEFGHAIQNQVGEPSEQSINVETQADCYAGNFVKATTKGTTHFDLTESDLDSVLGGYLFFRDAPGGDANEQGSHGSGFDRVTAFQQGFESGPKTCSTGFGDNRVFTEIPFNTNDKADQGNAKFDEIVALAQKESGLFYPAALGLDQSFADIQLQPTKNDAGECAGKPVAELVFYCDQDQTIFYSEAILKQAYENFGDYAVFQLLTLQYADAAITAKGVDLSGEKRFNAEICLTGGFAGDAFLLTQANQQTLGGSTLSAGDLDEALALLIALKSNSVVDSFGTSAFDRVDQFRQGFDIVQPSPDKVAGCLS